MAKVDGFGCQKIKVTNAIPKDIPTAERWYFLEEKYPAYGNLVPRDIATREIFQVCIEGYGVAGENQVYLDLTHIDSETLTRKLRRNSRNLRNVCRR